MQTMAGEELMKSRIFAIGMVIFLVASSSVVLCAQRGQDSGEGDQHRADPCTLVPDDPGRANGVERHCQFGGSSGVVKGDFNGDGIADLAVGIPNETRTRFVFDRSTGFFKGVDSPGAGAINILFGSSTGLSGSNSQVLDATPTAIADNAHFGTSLVAGKFHGVLDTDSDLAVGAPGMVKDGIAGAVVVFNNQGGFFSATKQPTVLFAKDLDTTGTHFSPFFVSFPTNMSMTWGDFDGDGFGDLAVEVNSDTLDRGASGVAIYFGGPFGLSESNSLLLNFDDGLSPNDFNPAVGCMDSHFSGQHFCAISRGPVSLRSADLNGDGIDELLIGAAGCTQIGDNFLTVSTHFDLGCVAIIPGRTDRPSRFVGWSALVGDPGKGFGASIAVGDFDGDGRMDIAIGQPGIAPGLTSVVNGAVRIFANPNFTYPNFAFVRSFFDDSTLIDQNTPGIGGLQSDGHFGATLAVNDFNLDGVSDLAVGSPNEAVAALPGRGAVNVIYGLSGVGLSTVASTNHPAAQTIADDTTGAAATSLTAWNFGKTAEPDLVIGAPLTNITQRFLNFNGGGFTFVTTQGVGRITVVYGSPSGLTVNSPQNLFQNQIASQSFAAGNHFGAAVY
jgi:FG-GAP repeat